MMEQRKLLMVFILFLASLPACSGCEAGHIDSRSEFGLNVDDLDSLPVPTHTITLGQLDAAPTYALGEDPDVRLGPTGIEPIDRWVYEAASFSNGRIAVLTGDMQEVRIYDADGTAFQRVLQFESPTEAVFYVVPGDTLIIGMSGLVLKLLSDGTRLGSDSVAGQVLGVLSDGSLITRTLDYKRREPMDGFWIESAQAPVFFFQVEPEGSTRKLAFSRILVTGRSETFGPGLSQVALPWHSRTMGAVSNGLLWISARGGPELVAVDPEGHPVHRLSWEAPRQVSSGEIRFWSAFLQSRGWSVSGDGLVPLLEEHEADATRTIDGLVSGSDGSLWVLERSRLGAETEPTTTTWLGFGPDLGLVGRLEVPVGTVLFEMSEEHVLADLPEDGASLLRFHLRAK